MKKIKINKKIIIGVIVAFVFVGTLTLAFAKPKLLSRMTGNVNNVEETLDTNIANYTEMCKYYNEALKLNLNDYSDTSKLEEALINLDWDLTEENQNIVDEETTKLKNAIASLKKKENGTNNSVGSSNTSNNNNVGNSNVSNNNNVTVSNKDKKIKKYIKTTSTKTTTNSIEKTTTESKKELKTVVTTTKMEVEVKSSKFNWWIIPIIVLVIGIVGFKIYIDKKDNK